jgi:hypothetical protein
MAPLQPIEILAGSFCFAFVIISVTLGSIIMMKYFKIKKRMFLFVGATWIFITESWWSSSLNFLMHLFTPIGLTPEWYFLVGFIFTPLAILIWLNIITDFLWIKRKKLVLIVYSIVGIAFEVIFFYFFINDVSQIGVLRGPVDGIYSGIILFFLLSGLLLFVSTGILFALQSKESEDVEVKLKGKLLIIALLLFLLGAGLDGLKSFFIAPEFLDVTLLINRIILSVSAIFFYGGFILPNWMKKIFLR